MAKKQINPKYLCYIRPGYHFQFKQIIDSAGLGSDTIYVSDFYSLKKYDWISYLDFNNCTSKSDIPNSEIKTIISRCRLLRNMNYYNAEILIHNSYFVINDFITKNEISDVFGLCIDSYIGDLFRYVINKKSGKYYGIVVSFIDGYFRLTELGESLTYRPIKIKELDNVYQSISKNINKAHFLPKKRISVIPRLFHESILIFKDFLRFIFFKVKSLFTKYRNYHVILNSKGMSGLPCYINKYFLYTQEPKKEDYLQLYFPLQVSPEATIDYWSSCKESIDYENYVLEIVAALPNIKFIIKENPSKYVRRTSTFYQKLSCYHNVTLVNLNIDSFTLLNICDASITVTGSIGIESVLLNKPAIVLGEPYYFQKNTFLMSNLDNNINEQNIVNYINNYLNSFVDDSVDIDSDKKKLLLQILSGLIPGSFKLPQRKNLFYWFYDIKETNDVGISLSKYLR